MGSQMQTVRRPCSTYGDQIGSIGLPISATASAAHPNGLPCMRATAFLLGRRPGS